MGGSVWAVQGSDPRGCYHRLNTEISSLQPFFERTEMVAMKTILKPRGWKTSTFRVRDPCHGRHRALSCCQPFPRSPAQMRMLHSSISGACMRPCNRAQNPRLGWRQTEVQSPHATRSPHPWQGWRWAASRALLGGWLLRLWHQAAAADAWPRLLATDLRRRHTASARRDTARCAGRGRGRGRCTPSLWTRRRGVTGGQRVYLA